MHGGSLRAKAIRSVQMKQKKKILWMLLPVLIFVGCGTQDSILKRGQPGNRFAGRTAGYGNGIQRGVRDAR